MSKRSGTKGPDEDVRVTVQHLEGLQFLATEGAHALVVDAATSDGGGGTGMSAPQLFVAALGACMLEFVANSCRLREIPVESIRLDLECQELQRPRRIGPIEAVLHIEPDLQDDVKRRLIGVARRSTLINTLGRPPEVAIRFAGEAGGGSTRRERHAGV
jgi:uncharacterized OsmC-like protein